MFRREIIKLGVVKMSDLIKITTKDGKQLVSARELHDFLEIKTEFRKWFPRMCEYGFVENVDFTRASGILPGALFSRYFLIKILVLIMGHF